MKAPQLPHLPKPKVLSVTGLLRPHWKAMTMAMVGVGGVAVTELLEPWPLKIVIDHLLQDRPPPAWIGGAPDWFGGDALAILHVAVLSVAVIAVGAAASTYLQSYLTTNVGQQVMHDLRKVLYRHIHRLSLAEHNATRTGDLIHHLATIQHADVIFVVKDHTLAERGRHAELLASGGFYSELYDIQFPRAQPDVALA